MRTNKLLNFFCRSFFILTTSFFISIGVTNAQTSTTTDSGYDIILVTGQSHAVGAGHGTYTDPTETLGVDNKIFQVGRWGAKNMKIIPIGCTRAGVKYDGLHFWHGPCTGGKGLTPTFARLYASQKLAAGRKVLIVPAAYGSTSVLWWTQREKFVPVGTTTEVFLLNDMEKRLKFALSQPGGKNKIVAVIWYQGETDMMRMSANPPTLTEREYRSALAYFVNRLLGRFPPEPGTFYPFLTAEMTPLWQLDNPNRPKIHKAIYDVFTPAKHAGIVSVQGLTKNPDPNLHYNAQSMVTLGNRFFEKYLELTR